MEGFRRSERLSFPLVDPVSGNDQSFLDKLTNDAKLKAAGIFR